MISPQTENANGKTKNKRKFWLFLLTAIFLLLALLVFLYWIFVGRFWVYTEDAYVHGNEVMLNSQVSGGVQAIYTDETYLVEEGQLVVEIDNTDFKIRLDELKSRFANTLREISGIFLDAEAKKSMVAQRRAELRQAQLNLEHRENLVGSLAVSQEEFETYATAVKVSEAQLESAIKSYDATLVQIANTTVPTHPRVTADAYSLKEAYLNLIRCQIWAPARGYVAKRSVQVGDQITAGQTLLFIVPLNDIWIEANYKETQLRKVRIGQDVEMTSDLYGKGVKFQGKVVGFQPGSGNAFALLPPQNASGNWIKIIQRVPVRIALNEEELENYPLLLGLSMHVHIHVRDTTGSKLTQQASLKPIYETIIYKNQIKVLEGIESVIDEMVKSNTQGQAGKDQSFSCQCDNNQN